MTAVAGSTPMAESRAGPARVPRLDLAAIQSLVENLVKSVETEDPLHPVPAEQARIRAGLIDRISRIESLRNSLSALQTATVRAFARAEAATRTVDGTVEPEKLERSIAAQIGLACATSPFEGRRRLHVARDLHDGHDHVRARFTEGKLSARKVAAIVGATSHLNAAERAEVDRRLSAHDVTRLGIGRLRDLTRRLAAEVAPEKFRVRAAAARSDRRVTLRPAADGMTDLIARLPVEQGVACLAALRRAVVDASVGPEPMTRSRGQIMADTLVERLTGQTIARDVPFDVQIVVPIGALIDPDSPLPAEIPGHGAVPVHLLATGDGRKTWRRIVTRDGIVIGGESSQRAFGGLLADVIRARDHHRCREPYCDAPAREIDHVRRSADGGPTTYANGRGICQFHNQIRELPGWDVERTSGGIRTTTPTGHRYLSPTPRHPTPHHPVPRRRRRKRAGRRRSGRIDSPLPDAESGSTVRP